MNAERWRLFVAVPVAEEVKIAISSFAQEMHRWPMRWTEPGNFHLTIRFFGDVEESKLPVLIDTLERAAPQGVPFRLQAKGLGQFHEQVLWVGVTGELSMLNRANELASDVATRLGHASETREFAPHITIAKFQRTSEGVSLSTFLNFHHAMSFGEWRVDHLELIRSVLSPGAAKYTTLARLPLGGPAPR